MLIICRSWSAAGCGRDEDPQTDQSHAMIPLPLVTPMTRALTHGGATWRYGPTSSSGTGTWAALARIRPGTFPSRCAPSTAK